ncbi:Hypothetical predicted protein [Podarcis lilfordi]|uniref:Uncharacterized protein n=1 Tax=Podarcis lilfordi TaxID=74358 RepID=A0AA35KC74_9SAUR|nr:Hypothetical predicted protein [Podarcis lilfordi]
MRRVDCETKWRRLEKARAAARREARCRGRRQQGAQLRQLPAVAPPSWAASQAAGAGREGRPPPVRLL